MDIIIASKNRGKIREILYFFRDNVFINWSSLADLEGFPDIDETGETFFENASLKATTVAMARNEFCLADDSGLSVDYLGGAPGVYSSRYSGENASDGKNRKKLLKELRSVDKKDRSARFVCSMVLADPSGNIIHNSTGVCEGMIGFEERGEKGFGYDSIFIPKDHTVTMAQLQESEKNRISHRGRALEDMRSYIDKLSTGTLP